MFIYNGLKIKGAWTHANGTSFPRGWVEGADAEQLTRYDVTVVADPVMPVYNPLTHWVAEENDGTLTLNAYSQAQIDQAQGESDVRVLKAGGKDLALVVVELVDYLLANTDMTATDFTPEVKQAYLDIKVIADRIKGN